MPAGRNGVAHLVNHEHQQLVVVRIHAPDLNEALVTMTAPARGQVAGLLEHVATGHTIAFANAEALLVALLVHSATDAAQAYRDGYGEEP